MNECIKLIDSVSCWKSDNGLGSSEKKLPIVKHKINCISTVVLTTYVAEELIHDDMRAISMQKAWV